MPPTAANTHRIRESVPLPQNHPSPGFDKLWLLPPIASAEVPTQPRVRGWVRSGLATSGLPGMSAIARRDIVDYIEQLSDSEKKPAP